MLLRKELQFINHKVSETLDGDGVEVKINIFEGEKLEITEQDLQRRFHFAARVIVTLSQFALLILMLFLLFYQVVPDSSRDLVSAITGMLVISQKDAVQYWFGHHRIEGSNH